MLFLFTIAHRIIDFIKILSYRSAIFLLSVKESLDSLYFFLSQVAKI